MAMKLKYHLDKAHAYLNLQAQETPDANLYQQNDEFYLQSKDSNEDQPLQSHLYT
jgi:hypothetical protein